MRDIYNRKQTMENLLQKLNSSRISKTNKELVTGFYNQCIAEGLSVARINKYLYSLILLARLLKKDFNKAKKDDIVRLAVDIEKNGNWSEYTKQHYKVVIKKFYKWLNGGEDYPKEVKWIKTTVKNNNKKLPNEILTEDEIYRMVKAADNSRDKALILVLYESGCRISEVINLKIKDISFDEYGTILIVTGKTGERRIRLVKGYGANEALKIWLDSHPFKDNKEAYVWLSLSTNSRLEPIGYRGVYKVLAEIGKKCGITKPLNPHAFRHARATHLANVLTEAQMKEMFGWTQGSKMASIYVHLSGRDVDKALIEKFGSVEIKKEKEKLNDVLNKWALGNPEIYRALVEFVEKELKAS
jgi:site-specific recombinase XerD